MLVRVEDLEDYVDNFHCRLAIENNSLHTSNPNKQKKKDSATDTDNLQTKDIQVSVLQIHKQKTSMLHQEIKDLRSSDLQTDNTQLYTTVELLTSQISTI